MSAQGFPNNDTGDFMQLLQLACGGWFSHLSEQGRMRGFIRHQGGVSLIEVRNYGNPLVIPPSVDCWEEWVRKNADWHYERQNDRFCWVLEEEWCDYFATVRKENEYARGVLAADAAEWLYRAMSLMLGRHLHGHEYGETKWRKEWQDYSHGHDGVHEYRRGTWRKS